MSISPLHTAKMPSAPAEENLSFEQKDAGGLEKGTALLKGDGRSHLRIMALHRHEHQQLFHNKSVKEKIK